MGYWRRSRLKVLIATVGISLAGLVIVATVYGTVAKNTRLAVIELEPANSEIDFDLDGFPHQVHGKFKIVSGKVEVDPSSGELSGLVVVDTASGDSGNGLRDAEMRDSILEAQRYPQITFTPSHCQQAVAMPGTGFVAPYVRHWLCMVSSKTLKLTPRYCCKVTR